MAKRRNRDRSEQRDSTHIASSLLRPTVIPDLLSLIEDRRTFNPAEYYPKGTSKLSSEIGIAPVKRSGVKRGKNVAFQPDIFRFKMPEKVALCVRRKSRREVLFALRKTGKGSRMVKRRRNRYSEISCK